MARFLLLFALAVFSVWAQTATLAGDWMGTLEVGSARLRLALHVVSGDAGLTAKLDSVDQGAMGLPVTTVTQQGALVRLELRALAASYEGRLNKEGAEITGEWRQGGTALPLTFKRSEGGLARPQDPKKPYPYHEEEIVIANKAGGVKLGATLTLPNGKGPFPAVMLLTGSGAQDRNESLFGHRPFLVLADHLTRQGVAVLRADDRGVGGSTGSLALATYDDLAGDALTGVEYLKSRKEINPKQIGLAGHSEGASVGMTAAGRSADIAFLVLLAGPGVGGEQLLYEQSKMIARLPGGSERLAAMNRKLQEAMFGALKRGAGETELRQAIATFAASMTEEDRAAAPSLIAAAEKQAPGTLTPAFRALLLFDPAPALAKVKCPVLALFGERDSQVPPSLNLPPMAAALESSGNREYALVKLPSLNHLFQTSKTGLLTEYASIEETIAPAALTLISAWIVRHAR
jgi:pimeloyl-ACP methyl ester carboxylesterase